MCILQLRRLVVVNDVCGPDVEVPPSWTGALKKTTQEHKEPISMIGRYTCQSSDLLHAEDDDLLTDFLKT